MNAPIAWPTKYPLPHFPIKRIALAGFGVLLASCSDGLTSPNEQKAGAGTAPEPLVPGLAAPDIIVMERTTTDAARDGEAPVVHTSREVLRAQVRLANASAGVRSLASGPPTTPQGIPRPPLSLPARREVAICNALPKWSDVIKGAEGRDVLISGVGDAPASTMKIAQADGSSWTVERTWTRTTSSWQLDRQVTRGAHGFKDVVTYQHQNALGKPVNNALPVAACTTQQQLVGQASVAASRTFYPAYSGSLYSKLVPGSGVSADDGCWDLGGDPCYDKRISVYKSDIALVGAATAMTLACVTPANVIIVTCIGATTIYFGAIANLALDQASLQHCLEEAAKPKGAELSVSTSTLPMAGSASGHQAHSLAPIGATTLNSCGNGDNSGSPSATHCRWDTYEISVDGGLTWSEFATFMICDNAS